MLFQVFPSLRNRFSHIFLPETVCLKMSPRLCTGAYWFSWPENMTSQMSPNAFKNNLLLSAMTAMRIVRLLVWDSVVPSSCPLGTSESEAENLSPCSPFPCDVVLLEFLPRMKIAELLVIFPVCLFELSWLVFVLHLLKKYCLFLFCWLATALKRHGNILASFYSLYLPCALVCRSESKRYCSLAQ